MLPSLVSLEKICSAFDMTMSQFLFEEDNVINIEQMELLEKWSVLNREQKEAIIQLIQTM